MRYIVLLTILFPFFIFSQSFDTDIRVTYLLESKDNKNSDKKNRKTYVLLIGENQSFFQPANTFVLDSIKMSNEPTSEDFRKFYKSKDQKKVVVKDNVISVYQKKYNIELAYKEDNNLSWILHDESKVISGIECRKATVHKWGRVWIAYYSTDYPIPFGPYKFNKLPGLIVEVRDSENEFIFTLKKISSYHSQLTLDDSKTKYLSKPLFYQTLFNMSMDNTLGGKIRVSPETSRRMTEGVKRQLRNQNFIERIPETEYK